MRPVSSGRGRRVRQPGRAQTLNALASLQTCVPSMLPLRGAAGGGAPPRPPPPPFQPLGDATNTDVESLTLVEPSELLYATDVSGTALADSFSSAPSGAVRPSAHASVRRLGLRRVVQSAVCGRNPASRAAAAVASSLSSAAAAALSDAIPRKPAALSLALAATAASASAPNRLRGRQH